MSERIAAEKAGWQTPSLVDLNNMKATAGGDLANDFEFHCIDSPLTSFNTIRYEPSTSDNIITATCPL